jgi:hypothetical protein
LYAYGGRALLGVANQVWANEVVMDYLREGRYEYSTPIPGQGNVKYVVGSTTMHTPKLLALS